MTKPPATRPVIIEAGGLAQRPLVEKWLTKRLFQVTDCARSGHPGGRLLHLREGHLLEPT